MAKFKPSHDFIGEKENKLFKANKETEMTIKRAEEVTENLHEIAEKDTRYEEYKDFEMKRTDKKDSE